MSKNHQITLSKQLAVFSGQANLPLARKIAKDLGVELGKLRIEKFSDTETRVVIEENVKGKDVYLIQSTSLPANEHIMELLIMAAACKGLKARQLIAVIPFYGYRRQEKQHQSGEAVTFSLIAKLLSVAGINKIMVMDLHKPESREYFIKAGLKCEEISAQSEILRYLRRKKLENFVVLAPDKGSLIKSSLYANALKVPLVHAEKFRDPLKKDQVVFKGLVGEVKGKNILIIDDEIDTAGTLQGVVKLIKAEGAKNIYFACTHGVLSGPALSRIRAANLKQLIITDTIFQPLEKQISEVKILSVAQLFSEKIMKNYA